MIKIASILIYVIKETNIKLNYRQPFSRQLSYLCKKRIFEEIDEEVRLFWNNKGSGGDHVHTELLTAEGSKLTKASKSNWTSL